MIRWQYRFELPVGLEEAWVLLSDTDRVNVAGDERRLEVTDEALAPGRTRRLIDNGSYQFVELPFEWRAPHWFSVQREYLAAPLRSYSWRADFEKIDPLRTGVTFSLEVEASRSWFEPVLGFFIRRKISAPIARSIATLRERLQRSSFAKVRTQPIPSRSSSLRTDRLPQMRASLLDRGVDEPVVQALLRQVEEATDVDLLHMAPFGLARVWGLPDDAVLRAFLYATRDSWMTLQWSLICPSCQGANAEVNDLARLAFEAHCPSCNIRYDATFSESVQVTFRPAKRLRPVEEAYVCVGGPGRTDHIRSAANVGPEETVELVHSLPQDDVPMRLRVQATGAVMEQPEPGDWAIQSDALVRRGPGDGITVQNDTEELQRVIYERSEMHGVLSAEVVTRHSLFRDLLSDQLIAPGTQIELQPLAFLFTDLKGSTALYEALGDAGAFEAVQSHFVLLREVLEAHAGTEVKTIGDAIMAVFGDPDQAISAAIAMQRAIQQNTRLALKVGVHFGRAMAVTFNRRLDYFGSAVNMAARLEGQSGADQIVCTAEMLDDPRVARVLEGFQSTREEVELKGIEGPMAIARIEVKR